MRRTGGTLVAAMAAALACTLVTATAVVAAGRPRTGITTKSVDTQLILWRTGKDNRAFTTSTKWQSLPMPDGGCVVGQASCSSVLPSEFMLWAKGPISLTFSGVFSGAPVSMRFRDGRLMRPGAVTFTPQQGNSTFSFTFVSGRRGKRECEGPILEWRSPTGQQVIMDKATIVVHYKKYQPENSVRCY